MVEALVQIRDLTKRFDSRKGLFGKRRPTLMFNGYGEHVAGLYAGLDLKANY